MSNLISNYFGNTPQQSDGLEAMCADFQLTRTQRMYGFGICFAVGTLISILSTIFLFFGNMIGFAVLYTFGNIIALAGTGFLIGFITQFKKMFDSTRLISTLVFLGAMVMTLVSAFAIKSGALTLVFCIIQFFALIWYSISYIPFAQQTVISCFKGCLGMG